MLVKDLLSPSNAYIEPRRLDKAALLLDLSKRAASAAGLAAPALYAEIMRREELGSTGIGQGIALPHTRVDGLKEPFSLMVRLAHAIDFESVDGHPVDLVFFMLLPSSPPNAHLNALACVSRTLRDTAIQQQLRGAGDAAALYGAITQSLAQQG